MSGSRVTIIQGIERGDALPGLRSYDDIAKNDEEGGGSRCEGTDLVKPPAQPWCSRLKMDREWMLTINKRDNTKQIHLRAGIKYTKWLCLCTIIQIAVSNMCNAIVQRGGID
ncbi:Methyltransferase type 11 [Sesbania bispinosa]|nr:Methyltransferase type 11 [Sesbania bispinosa]